MFDYLTPGEPTSSISSSLSDPWVNLQIVTPPPPKKKKGSLDILVVTLRMWSLRSCQLALWGSPVTTARNSVWRPVVFFHVGHQTQNAQAGRRTHKIFTIAETIDGKNGERVRRPSSCSGRKKRRLTIMGRSTHFVARVKFSPRMVVVLYSQNQRQNNARGAKVTHQHARKIWVL